MPEESRFTTRARSIRRDEKFSWGDDAYPWSGEVETVDGVAFTNGGARPERRVPDSGFLRWTFDDAAISGPTVLDEWHNNDGVIDGATPGVAGGDIPYSTQQACSFDGSNDRVSLGTAPDLSMGWSFAFWVHLDSTISSEAGVVDAVWGSGDSNDYARFVYDGSNMDMTVRGADTTDNQTVLSDTAPALGSWTHYILSGSDTGELYLFKDGAEIASDTSTFDDQSEFTPTSDGDLIVGYGRSAKFITYASMDVADVRIYRKGLDSNEASNLYNTGRI